MKLIGVIAIWLCRGCKHDLSEEMEKAGLVETVIGLAALAGLFLAVFFVWFLARRILSWSDCQKQFPEMVAAPCRAVRGASEAHI